MDKSFRGYAPNIQARAAKGSCINNNRINAKLASANGRNIAARASANNKIGTVNLGHLVLYEYCRWAFQQAFNALNKDCRIPAINNPMVKA